MSGQINVSGRMSRKSVTKDINGQIINMLDEEKGGYIIRNRQIVNPVRWEEIQKAEKDKRDAALAVTAQVESPNAELRTMAPADARAQLGQIENLKNRIDGQDAKLDAILAALSKK